MAGLQSGALSPSDHCWAPGFKSWQTIQEAIVAPKSLKAKFNPVRLATHVAAAVCGAAAYAIISLFIETGRAHSLPTTENTVAIVEQPEQRAVPQAPQTQANPTTAAADTVIAAVAEKQPDIKQEQQRQTAESKPKTTARPMPLSGRFERLAKSPIKLSPSDPTNKGPFRISGCIASNIDINYLSWPVRVNDDLPPSNMISTYEDMERRSVEKPDWNNGYGALALTFVIENKSKYVVQSPVVTAALLDENGDRIASASYTWQSGAPFITMAPGDRACYRLVVKCGDGKSLAERAKTLATFSKVKFAMYLGSEEVELTQDEWIEAAQR